MHSKIYGIITSVAALALALVLALPGLVSADTWNRKTIFSVSEPFQIPGAILEPDQTYVMELLDSGNARQVVRIFNEDETELISTFMGNTTYRLEPEDETVFTFIETEAGYPMPIRKWFYPGMVSGLEFIYSEDAEFDIAQHLPEEVLAASSGEDVDLSELESVRVVSVHPDDVEPGVAVTRTAAAVPPQEEPVAPSETDQSVAVEKQEDMEVERAKPAEPAPVDDTDVNVDTDVDLDMDADASSEIGVQEPEIEQDDAEPAALPATAGYLGLLALLGAGLVSTGFILRR